LLSLLMRSLAWTSQSNLKIAIAATLTITSWTNPVLHSSRGPSSSSNSSNKWILSNQKSKKTQPQPLKAFSTLPIWNTLNSRPRRKNNQKDNSSQTHTNPLLWIRININLPLLQEVATINSSRH
jgi:hypothetical protein